MFIKSFVLLVDNDYLVEFLIFFVLDFLYEIENIFSFL